MEHRPNARRHWAAAALLASALTLAPGVPAAWGREHRPRPARESARRLPVQVQGVSAGDTLNVRRTANPGSAIVARIPPDAGDVIATGRQRRYRSSTWRQIEYQGTHGWVNARFVSSGEAEAAPRAKKPTSTPTLASVASLPSPHEVQDNKDNKEQKEQKEQKEKDQNERGEGKERSGLRDKRAAASPGEYPGEKQFFQCRKLPNNKAVLKLNLKPDTEITDLIGWMSAISCTPFLLPAAATLKGKKVT